MKLKMMVKKISIGKMLWKYWIMIV